MHRSSRRRFRTRNRGRAAAAKLRPHSHRGHWSNRHRPSLIHKYHHRSSRPRPNRDRNHRSTDHRNQYRVLSQGKNNHPLPARLNPTRTQHSNIQRQTPSPIKQVTTRRTLVTAQLGIFAGQGIEPVKFGSPISACRMHITAAHER